MASPNPIVTIQDSLYGRVEFPAPLSNLLSAPLVQRLRHIRLSNIDSIDLPGIANISRFEHILGVAHLASIVGLRPTLGDTERFVFDAAAILHDWAITSFGHLVEEAFNYVDVRFEHEAQLERLAAGGSDGDIGGVEHRQILAGREMGLYPWLAKTYPDAGQQRALLAEIAAHIEGQGKYGKIIAGTIDLDNIDNVVRMAYHLGLVRDGDLALRLSRSIVGVDAETGSPVFSSDAVDQIDAWLALRREVYTLLMLSEGDFAGKLMLIFATVTAYKAGLVTPTDWSMTDGQFFERLRTSTIPDVRETAERWETGELWDMVPLSWFSGRRPDYSRLYAFSLALSKHMDRPFFAYGIKDKRDRRLQISIAGEGVRTFGSDSDQWLLGFGSSKKRAITAREQQRAWSFAEEYLGSRRVATVVRDPVTSEAAWLI